MAQGPSLPLRRPEAAEGVLRGLALVAEWRRQSLSDGTVKNRMAPLRWLARKIGKPGIVRRDNASYGVGARCAP